MTQTLYISYPHGKGAKIQITAAILNYPLAFNRIQHAQLKTKEYLSKHPLGKMPILETSEGILFQSNAILRYVARKGKGLYGNNKIQAALIDQWLQYVSLELQPFNYQILGPIFGWKELDSQKYQLSKDQVERIVKILDAHLKSRTFFVGDSLSIADIAIGSILNNNFRLVFDEKFRQKIPNLTRWYINFTTLPAYAAYYGKAWLCSTEYKPLVEQKKIDTTKKQEPKPQIKQKQKKKDQKKGDLKKEIKKEEKIQPKKKKKQQVQEQQEELEEIKIQKKKVNPLDQLPKSTFVFDEFKRQFSNSLNKAEVIKNFWTKYDPVGYSIWKVRYNKKQGENTVDWLTSNLKNGVIRNIDHFRKYSFHVGGVYGSQGSYEISTIWLWRGTQIPEEWKEHQSYDSHTFKKLDHNSEQDRRLVEEYWLNTQQGQLVQGLPVYDVGYFK